MPTINEIARKVAERQRQAEIEAQERAQATEQAIERMLDIANQTAFYAIKLRAALDYLEAPLKDIAIATHRNIDISLETANALSAFMEETHGELEDFIEAVELTFGVYGESVEEEDEDEACDCCEDIRRAEAAFDYDPSEEDRDDANARIDAQVEALLKGVIDKLNAGPRA